MERKVFKIICEGNTDFAVIKEVVPAVGVIAGEKYKAEELFPPNRKSNAGWSNLKLWCKQQASILSGTINAQYEAAAKILGARPAGVVANRKVDLITAACKTTEAGITPKIFIQIDSDIAHDLLADAGLDPNSVIFPMHPSQRIDICEKALDAWLGPHSEKKGILIFYCVNSLALENWILTLHDSSELGLAAGVDYDLIHAPDQILIGLGYPTEKIKGEEKLKKAPGKYKEFGKSISAQLAVCRLRSGTLDEFCKKLIAA